MATIYLNPETRAIVQGITGKVGQTQAHWMIKAGTNLVAGVTPGKGGQIVEGLPVYDTVAETVEKHNANASVIFVPASFARGAALEAIAAGLKLIVIVTEHIPMRDAMEIKAKARLARTTVIGPNCPGIYIPGFGKLGIMPESIFKPGNIGVTGRSATLSYEVIANLSDASLGQTAAIGIGGDPVVCTEFTDALQLFEADEATQGVVLVGEIGGAAEERAAEYIAAMTKPVVALIAGLAAPAGRRFGHAGAIIRAGSGTAQHKIEVLKNVGVTIAETPAQIPGLMKQRLKK
ncbi:MAG: succinate--CoA ligase subunit alpha [Anaerolineaceae bacterium]